MVTCQLQVGRRTGTRLGVCVCVYVNVKVKKTFWLREFTCLLKGEHGNINQAVEMLESDGQLTMHLMLQIIRMYLIQTD